MRDPLTRELVTAGPEASFRLVMAGDGIGVGEGRGAGDCDCATVALGSLYESVGFPVRLVTIARPGVPAGQLMDHIYPEVDIPRIGWIPADPVLHPRGSFGDSPPASRKVIYSLEGSIIEYSGNLGNLEDHMARPTVWDRPGWRTYDASESFFGSADSYQLDRWDSAGLKNFGSLADRKGVLFTPIPAEVGNEQTMFYHGLARTPMIEVCPSDFDYMRSTGGRAYNGMMGLGDDGQIYVYDGFGGFFKKLFKKIGKAAKKAGEFVTGKYVVDKIREGKKDADSATAEKKTQTVASVAAKKGWTPSEVAKAVQGRIRKDLPKITQRVGDKTFVRLADKPIETDMAVKKPSKVAVRKQVHKVVPVAAVVPGDGPAIRAAIKIALNLQVGGQGKGKRASLSGTNSYASIAAQRAIAPYLRR